TFTLTVTTPQQTSTTAPLAYNISAADLQAALDGLTGLQTSVSGQGTNSDPWVIFGQYVLAFGTIEEGTNLAFDFDPGFAAGTAVQYQAVAGKPISGLTDGATYYATAATNAFFNPNLPQYLLTLAASAASGSPAIAMPLSQSLTDPQGREYTVSGVAADSGLLLVELPDSATVTAVEAGGLIGGTAELGSVPAGAVQCFSFATGGSFALTVTPASGANVGTPT
ncbi:MAG: hypothetical protein ACKOJF_10715, partial [Planctomycetaceae bacterium]